MGEPDDERIADLEARLWHDDPRFARGLGKGRPRRPRETAAAELGWPWPSRWPPLSPERLCHTDCSWRPAWSWPRLP